jgi:hypothetical protein
VPLLLKMLKNGQFGYPADEGRERKSYVSSANSTEEKGRMNDTALLCIVI